MRTTSDERADFGAALRAYLASAMPESEVRRLLDEPVAATLGSWSALNDQFGLADLAIPEDLGGQGLGVTELAVALKEGARVLLPAPLLAHSTAVLALRLAGGEAADSALRRLAGGEMAVLAGTRSAGPEPEAVRQGDTWLLSGQLPRVTDVSLAESLLVVAQHDGQAALFLVDAKGEGVSAESLSTLDLTRRQSAVELDGAPASLISRSFDGHRRALEAVAAILASAELLGVAERALEIGVDYAKERHQFGVPIGSFQAVKHMLAESLASVEMLRAGVAGGAEAVDQLVEGRTSDPAPVLETAAVVKAFASEHGPRVVETLIQVLGGIGYTWEHPAHLYLRRARSLAQQFGSAREQRALLASELGLASA